MDVPMFVHAAGAQPVEKGVLADATALAGVAIPPVLHASVERHRAHLARLVVSLQRAGVSESQIEASVNAVVASYKAELLEAIKSLVGASDV
jgi:hypothetical protein